MWFSVLSLRHKRKGLCWTAAGTSQEERKAKGKPGVFISFYWSVLVTAAHNFALENSVRETDRPSQVG
jgi:hypothetical protein